MAKFKRGNLDLKTNQKIRLGDSLTSQLEYDGSKLKISDPSQIRIDANGAENFMIVSDGYLQMYTNSSAQGSNYEMLRIDKDAEIMYIGSPLGGIHLRYIYDSDPVIRAYAGTTWVMNLTPTNLYFGGGGTYGPQLRITAGVDSSGDVVEINNKTGYKEVFYSRTGDGAAQHEEVFLGGNNNDAAYIQLDRTLDTIYMQTTGGITDTGWTMTFDGLNNLVTMDSNYGDEFFRVETDGNEILNIKLGRQSGAYLEILDDEDDPDYFIKGIVQESEVLRLKATNQTIGVGSTDVNMVLNQVTDNLSIYMDSGEGQGYNQVVDIDGDAGASEINLGLQTETYLKIGIGSSPTIRAMSGTSEWLYIDPDDQRLGDNAAGGSFINVTTSNRIMATVQGVSVLDLDYDSGAGELKFGTSATYYSVDLDSTELYGRTNNVKVFGFEEDIQRVGLSSFENIYIDQVNNLIQMFIAGSEVLAIDSTSVVVTGDVYCDDLHVSGDTIFIGDNTTVGESTGGINISDGTRVADIGYSALGGLIIGADDLVITNNASNSGGIVLTGKKLGVIEQRLIDAIPGGAGGVNLYYDGENLFSVGFGGTTFKTGGSLGMLVYADGGTAAFLSQDNSSLVGFSGKNASSITVSLLVMDPDGSVELYYDSVKTFETNADGIKIYDDTGREASVGFFAGTDSLELVNEVVDGTIIFQGNIAGPTLKTLASFDPAGAAELYYAGVKVFETDSTGIVINSITTNGEDLVVDCGTEKTLKIEEGVWKDINLSSALLTGPTSGQPDTDSFVTEGGADTGIDTYAFAVGEKVHGVFEIQHDYKEGTDIYFHIHWQGIAAPTGTDNVNWQIDYTIASNEATLDAIRAVTTGDATFDTQYEFKTTEFGVINGQTGGNNGGPIAIGDQMLFTLTRIASVGDAYAGDALLATVGIHYQVDTMGSRQKTLK